jgi:hypothetical protein
MRRWRWISQSAGCWRRLNSSDFALDVPGQAEGILPLSLGGGAPKVQGPGFLDFGQTAFVPDSGVSSFRWVTVANVGGPSGAPASTVDLVVDPNVSAVPANANTLAGEFVVELPAGTGGLTAAPGKTVALKLVLTPRSIGAKAATVTLLTNDPLTPLVTIAVTAMVAEYAPCQFELSSQKLEFGVVHATWPLTRGFIFRNSSAAACLVTFGLSPTTPPDFALSGVPASTAVVPPLGELALPVTLTPREAVGHLYRPKTGSLELQVSSPASPLVKVALSGGAGPACLALLPRQLSYGSLVPGAATSATSVRLVNLCWGGTSFANPLPVFLVSVTVDGDSGDFPLNLLQPIPPGGLEEIHDSNAGYRFVGVTPNTVPFDVGFAPTAAGTRTGAVVMTFAWDGQQLPYVVPLDGRGDPSRQALDAFTQGGGDPVDVVMAYQDQEETFAPVLINFANQATNLTAVFAALGTTPMSGCSS